MRERFQMSRASSQIRAVARRLIAHETAGHKSSAAKTAAIFPVAEKLRPHLVMLMGNGGFRALLSRALALANAEVLWLRAVHVKADGSMEGSEELQTQIDPDDFMEGGVALLAELLGLLVAFIGVSLTVRLLRDVWPTVPLNDSDFAKGQK